MMISELDQHEINCAYRMVLCIFEKCSQQLPMPKLFAHLQTFHPTHLNFTIPMEPRLGEVRNSGGRYFSHQNNSAEKIIKKEVSVCITFLKLGLNFFFKCTGSVYDQEAAFLLYYLGPPQEAEKFSFEFGLSKHESQKETIVTGPSVSVANPVPARQIRCHRHSFHFTLNSFKLKTIGKLTTFSWYGK